MLLLLAAHRRHTQIMSDTEVFELRGLIGVTAPLIWSLPAGCLRVFGRADRGKAAGRGHNLKARGLGGAPRR